jgi:hypothetical protein
MLEPLIAFLIMLLIAVVALEGWLIQRDIRRATAALLRGLEELLGKRNR